MLNRREFIATVSAAGATSLGIADDMNGNLSEVVAVRNGTPVEMFRKGIARLGGMKAFVKPGQRVVVKPNAAWDRTPEEAANTNPDLVGEIVRQALEAGAAQVLVFDHTCNSERNAYARSGIEAAVKGAGGKMISGADEADYVERDCSKAIRLKHAKIHKAILEADAFINVPVLKNHGGTKMTSAMKNSMGWIWDRQYMHKNDLPQCIADLILYRKPDLNVVDAYRIMISNGPRGISKADVRMPKYQLLSRDIVAIDAQALKLLRYKPEDIHYLQKGERLGLGNANESKIRVTRIDA